jgi:hypothetical protein
MQDKRKKISVQLSSFSIYLFLKNVKSESKISSGGFESSI